MQAVIVGADRIEGIRSEILRVADQFGIKQIDHWTGRKASENRRQLSRRTGLVVFMCDRANHMLMRNVRKQAEDLGIPMVFCRHSATEVRERLDDLSCARCTHRNGLAVPHSEFFRVGIFVGVDRGKTWGSAKRRSCCSSPKKSSRSVTLRLRASNSGELLV